jgi:hypothetical protein
MDDEILEISCPRCGKKIRKPVRWFKQSAQRCPFGCGTVFDTSELRRGIEQAEKDLRDLFRRFQ